MEMLELAQRFELDFLTREQICSPEQTSCFVFVNFDIEVYG